VAPFDIGEAAGGSVYTWCTGKLALRLPSYVNEYSPRLVRNWLSTARRFSNLSCWWGEQPLAAL
jgi:hypothetical protein